MVRIDKLGTSVDGDVRVEFAAWDDDDGLVGTARIENVLRRKPGLVDLYVRHTHRRLGIGEALTVAAMEWAREGKDSLYLYVGSDNTKAINLYEKLDWEHLGEDDDGDLWMKYP
jgi:GNAT superfamily N-acetyltransferase